MQDILRTPDERFEDLPDFNYSPHYVQLESVAQTPLRMHYIDEGPRQGPVVLMLHGEPSWSFSWRKVIKAVVAAGYRAVAPDHIGFGRSDKPVKRGAYSYSGFVCGMSELMLKLDLQRVLLMAQDWGGPIGLRTLAAMPDRFGGVIVANTLLPNCLPPPQGIVDWPGEIIKNWAAMTSQAEDLPVAEIVAGVSTQGLSPAVKMAYDAPFPDRLYKAGVLEFPSLIPQRADSPGIAENRQAWEVLTQWRKPFVTAFSDGDPTTRPWEEVFQRRVPGALGMPHRVIKNAGHFVQEEQGEALAACALEVLQSYSL